MTSHDPDPLPALPLLDAELRPERADAARNRRRILDAARSAFAEQGVAGTTMDDIARRAGVGKGTLYRRFGDQAGLAAALLDERERAIQDAILHGPPPLGPGAAAGDRLRAFADALLDYLETDLELIRLSETAAPGARYRIGAYAAWRLHIASLLRELEPAADATVLADVLLASFAADLQHHLRLERDLPPDRIAAAVRWQLERLLG